LISVLISVYYKDDPAYLDLGLKRIWDEKSHKPAEIVLVKDGLLTPELDMVIDKFSKTAPLKIVSLDSNKGLGDITFSSHLSCTGDTKLIPSGGRRIAKYEIVFLHTKIPECAVF
jgi:hypothetical protein